MRRAKLIRFGVALAVGLSLAQAPAGAHRSPARCNANNLALNVSQDRMVVRNGDTITYTVTTANVDAAAQEACDVTGTTITLTLPAVDGSPSGAKVTLASGVDYPAGTQPAVLGTVPYVVAVNPGVAAVVVKAEAAGVLHDAPNDDTVDIIKTLSTTVTQPHTTLTVSAEPARGRVPLEVTYRYVETNDSTTDAPISGVAITDDGCAPLRLTGGDTDADGILDTGEAWSYTCRRTLDRPGRYHSHVEGRGTNAADGRAAPLEQAEVTVVASNPHTTLAVSPNPAAGPAPLTVTYAYTEVNDGTEAISGITVTDDACAPVVLESGDDDGDSVLDPGETWRLACTRTFTEPGRFASRVTATGDVVSDGRPHPVETAEAVVEVAAPPPAPATPTVLAAVPTSRGSGPSRRLGFTGFALGGLVLAGLVLVAVGAGAARAGGRGRRGGGGDPAAS